MANPTNVHAQPGMKSPEHPEAGVVEAQQKHGLPRVQPTQPEDATHTTGAGGAAHKESLGHNVEGNKQAEQSEHSAPGQHATGSYTDKK